VTIRFGVTLPQFTGKRDRFVTGALRAEDLGYDSVWVFDHLWPLGGGRERPVLEAWTALAYLAAATRRVSVGSLVTRSSLRHPVLLAKMIATVGAIAPGRLICGLGSGDELSRPENEAFGLTYLSGVDRINQLASTLEVVTAYSSEGVAGHTDGFAHVTSLPTSPQP
jgi:alkanesulfonate monooxygenase SsuD/methylene tetrahydromethanopterin reductase-like flavin-dependent oxidoreductase (luciferase family)